MSGARHSTRAAAIDLVFASSLTALAVYSFESSFGTLEFFLDGLVGVVLGAMVAYIGVRRRLDALFIGVALFAGYVLVGGTMALRHEATMGFLPSLTTLRGALDGSVLAWKRLLTTVPPVGGMGDLLVVPFFCGAFGTALSFVSARRFSSVTLPLVPPTAVLALGILCGVERPVSVILHGAVMAGGVLAWFAVRHQRRAPAMATSAADRRRRTATAAVLVAAFAGAGFFAGPQLPLVAANERVLLRQSIDPPFDPYEYPSPLSKYRDFVKQPTDGEEPALLAISGLPKGVPIRLATMDTYDGLVWRVSGGTGTRSGSSGYFERVGIRLPADFDGRTTTISVEILSDWTDVWIPTVGEVTRISFRSADPDRAAELERVFRYATNSDTGVQQQRLLRKGDSYEMDVVLPPILAADGFSGLPIAVGASDVGNLPVPDELTAYAAEVVQGVSSRENAVIALRDALVKGYFSDGADGQLPSLGGHSAGRLVSFVEDDPMVGNAEQYAAAFGLMLRSMAPAVTSRVVIGFVPEEFDAADYSAEDRIEIKGSEAEAWVEVPVAGDGWVALFPTPEESPEKRPQDLQTAPRPKNDSQEPPPPPVMVEDPRSEPSDRALQPEPEETPDLPGERTSLPLVVLLVTAAVGMPLLVLILCSSFVALLKARRRRRRRSRGSASERAANGFREVVDAARDLGRPIPPNLTRRELTPFVAAPSSALVAMAADSIVFGPGEGDDAAVELLWHEVETVFAEMRSDVGSFGWLKARLSLSSLRKGWS